jgi:hypothetical protein
LEAKKDEATKKEKRKNTTTAKRKRKLCKGEEIRRGEGGGVEKRCVGDKCLLCDVYNI